MQVQPRSTPKPKRRSRPSTSRAPLRGPVLPPPRLRPAEDGRVAAAVVVFSGS